MTTQIALVAAICAGMLHCQANAEKLVMPMFPGKGGWTLMASDPITFDGRAVGKMVTYRLSSDDTREPKNTITTFELEQRKAISPADYVNNHAQIIQRQCESMQVTRPTHLLERRVPVSYARLYCGKLKGKEEGGIQVVKALQGKGKLFLVVRDWATPPFSADASLFSSANSLAKNVFKTDEEAAIWQQQMTEATVHLESAVTLCAQKRGEFGDDCPSQ